MLVQATDAPGLYSRVQVHSEELLEPGKFNTEPVLSSTLWLRNTNLSSGTEEIVKGNKNTKYKKKKKK